MSNKEFQQDKLDRAIKLISLAMPEARARLLKSSYKEGTVNLLFELQSQADIAEINSVILTMEELLSSAKISIVKLYRSLGNKSKSKFECFSTLDLNQACLEAEEEAPFTEKSVDIRKEHMTKVNIDSRGLKQQGRAKNPVSLILGSFIIGVVCGWAVTPKLPPSPIAEYIPLTLPPQSEEIIPTDPPSNWDPILDERFRTPAENVEDCHKLAVRYKRPLVAIYNRDSSFFRYDCILADREED